MFLQNLRSETAFSHLTLEQNPYSLALMSPSVTLEDYSNYLKRLYGFVYGFESYVYPILNGIDPEIDSRRKSELLQTDLKNLGIDLSVIPIIPAIQFHLHYPDAISALGGLYVLEGSMLGGIMIKKHLSEKLSNQVLENMHYLTGYGSETRSVWKNFLDILLINTTDINTQKVVIDSAKNTFDLLNQWIGTSTLTYTK